MIGDTAYGTGKVRAELAERGVEVVTPVPKEPEGKLFPKAAFRLDLEAGRCECPAGQVTEEKRYSRSGRLRAFIFGAEQCGSCDWRKQCTSGKHGRRQVTVHPQEEHLQRAQVLAKTERFRELYAKRHAEMVRHGQRQARYLGRRKVTLQARLVATVVNFKRYWRLLLKRAQGHPVPQPVPT